MINNHPIESTSNIQFDYAGVQNGWMSKAEKKNRLDPANAQRLEKETKTNAQSNHNSWHATKT